MKKNSILVLFVCLFLSYNGYSQVAPAKKKLTNPFENEGTIDARFNYLYKTSTNYLEYKVISKKGFATIQNNVKDSINGLKKLISSKNELLQKQEKSISTFKNLLDNSKEELSVIQKKQDSISFLGLSLNKQNYNLIIIIIITTLIVSTAFFVYKYQNSLASTKSAIKNQEDTQREFEIYQKKALERQQVLNRKLQDEIMKNRKD